MPRVAYRCRPVKFRSSGARWRARNSPIFARPHAHPLDFMSRRSARLFERIRYPYITFSLKSVASHMYTCTATKSPHDTLRFWIDLLIQINILATMMINSCFNFQITLSGSNEYHQNLPTKLYLNAEHNLSLWHIFRLFLLHLNYRYSMCHIHGELHHNMAYVFVLSECVMRFIT